MGPRDAPTSAATLRERAKREQVIADETNLPNVRERAQRAAAKWLEMADRIDRVAGRAVKTD